MANKDEEVKKEMIEVPADVLLQMQKQMTEMEIKMADQDLKNAGLEELISKGATTNDDLKLRERKNFEPKFRTVRIRQYPIAGDENNLGYVVGWTSKGAYPEVVSDGMTKEKVDFIDIIFLGNEKTKEGKLKAEKVRLLDLLNRGVQVHCKVIETVRKDVPHATGEEIEVSVFDPVHGLVSTGERVDGFYVMSEIKNLVAIPGHGEVWIDGEYCNR